MHSITTILKKILRDQKYYWNLNHLGKTDFFLRMCKLSTKEVYGHFIIPFFEELKRTKIEFEFKQALDTAFSNFSCMFLNPNYFFLFEF